MDVPRVTRRRFLTWSGVAGGSALAAGGTAITVPQLLGSAGTLAADARILVLVTLYGGNDGLGTVVPAKDPAYRKARPNLSFSPGEVLPLGDDLGLNPALRGFKSLWETGNLAIVRGVSYPKPDHSHFKSMAIWQTASPATAASTGWIGRWLDASGRNPLHAVSLDSTLPPMMAGQHCAGAALQAGKAALPRQLLPGLQGLAKPQSGEPVLQARAATAIADLLKTGDVFGSALAKQAQEDPDDDATSEGGTAGAQGRLAGQLGIVARCIKARVPTRVYSVSLGGFDTHAAERPTQSRLLGQLDSAVSAFIKDAGPGVVVAVYSEFGRRVHANANQGTDHGTSGPVLVAGSPVKGGFYGDQPSLTDLADGDLKVTTDFRDVYATLLSGVLKADPARILSERHSTLKFL